MKLLRSPGQAGTHTWENQEWRSVYSYYAELFHLCSADWACQSGWQKESGAKRSSRTLRQWPTPQTKPTHALRLPSFLGKHLPPAFEDASLDPLRNLLPISSLFSHEHRANHNCLKATTIAQDNSSTSGPTSQRLLGSSYKGSSVIAWNDDITRPRTQRRCLNVILPQLVVQWTQDYNHAPHETPKL